MRNAILIILLLALCSPARALPLTEAETQQAQRLLINLGCRSCHDLDKSGSTLAGSLQRIGLKLGAEDILARLQLPPEKLGQGDKFMPSYQSTPPEHLDLISRYLSSRK